MIKMIEKLVWLRLAQLHLNDSYNSGVFKIPIHLALGHEAIAVSINNIVDRNDHMLLTHRNIHYNLLGSMSVKPELDEFLLKKSGLAKGQLGSMNLSNKEKNIEYSSSILGNNLSVACGVTFGKKINQNKGITIVVTGDGAIEEGSFYESLLFAKSFKLPLMFLIENNEWSLGTRIDERRGSINLKKMAQAFDIKYYLLEGNDVIKYRNRLRNVKKTILKTSCPSVVEVNLKTLGYWIKKDEQNPNGRFINYHAGPINELKPTKFPIIENSIDDPVFVLQNYIDFKIIFDIAEKLNKQIIRDIK